MEPNGGCAVPPPITPPFRNYTTAQAALKSAGQQPVAAVTLVAERHALPSVEDWPAARRGADALAAHFRLEERDQFEEFWRLFRRRGARLKD